MISDLKSPYLSLLKSEIAGFPPPFLSLLKSEI